MRAKQGLMHILYTWLVVGLAAWQMSLLLPALELDKWRELIVIVFLGALAEWLAVSFPHGQLSGGFALVLSTFLIYGTAATAWVSGLATLIGQGIANQGNPVRTTFFNSGQYVLAVVTAGYVFNLSRGIPGQVELANLLPLVLLTASYIVTNHLLVYLYLLPDRRHSTAVRVPWLDTVKWDGLTYLFTVPLGLLITMVYRYVGLTGTLLLFFSILVLQFILRFYVRLQVANREMTTFYEVARFLEKNPGPEEMLEYILRSAKRAFSYHSGVVYLNTGEKDTYLPAAVAGPYAKQLRSTAAYAGEGIAGRSIANREPEIVLDSRTDPRTEDEAGLCQFLRSLLVVPLLSGSEALGVIVLGDKRTQAFDEKHLHIMAVLAGQAAVAVENAVIKSRLEESQTRDALTGLLHTSLFFEMTHEICEEAIEDGTTLGLILIDIDRFRAFNLHYGRQAGELLLEELGGLAADTACRGDLAARYGGDEFALLLPGASGPRLLDIAEKLREVIRRHVFLRREGRIASITASIGVAELPRDAGQAEGLYNAAQRALDKAKEGGGDQVESAAATLSET